MKPPKSGKHPKILRRCLAVLLCLALVLGGLALGLSAYVCSVGGRLFCTERSARDLEAQAILVLGAAIWEGDRPCPMLQDRLDEAISLYFAGAAPKLLMSGDGTGDSHETQVMAAYAQEQGVPAEDILQDPAGYCTRDSLVRAKTVYGLERVLVVTQKYHLYRALYIAQSLGLEARGVASDPRAYAGQFFREVREVLARDKDALLCWRQDH